MNIRKRQLWKVPVYCTAAGYVGFYLMVYAIAAFAVEILPDGSHSANSTLTTILMALLFGMTLLIGHFLFRSMTKREIFLSASILVIPLLAAQLLQLLCQGSGLSIQLGICLAYATEWSRLLTQICYALTQNVWISAFLGCLAPYLFILSGTKEPAA